MKTGTFDPNKTRASNIAWNRRTQANAREKPRQPRKPLAAVSKAMKPKNALYVKARAKYMADNPFCECGRVAVHCHHLAGRSGLNRYRHFKSVCQRCHDMIHAHPREAREIGLLVRVDGREELGELGRVEN